MKNKLILIILAFLFASLGLSANALSLNIIDKKDGNVDIFAVLPSNNSIEKAIVKFEAIKSGDILFEKSISSSNKISAVIPNEPYLIVLDAGYKQQIVKAGITPVSGFTKNIDVSASAVLSQMRNNEKEYNKALIILWGIACLLVLLTLYFSIKNTNILIKRIQS